MFARLFAMTSTLVCWANIPVAAMLKALMVRTPLGLRHGADFLDCLLQQILARLGEIGACLIGAHDIDHARDLEHGLDIGFFDHALAHTWARDRVGRLPGRIVKAVSGLL